MEHSSVLLVCILMTCCVWTVHGRTLQINTDDQELVDIEVSAEAGKIPGICWACKWALKKVKKVLGSNETAEAVTKTLNSVCNEIGLLKSMCRKFVKKHLGELIEELSTTDDVKTICVNTGACKPTEWVNLLFYSGDVDATFEMTEYP